MMNPYEVLGIPETATPDEVKKAYRKKARENHPDLNPNDPKAAERMNQINEAYDRITNPEKYAKERYQASSADASGSPYGGASGSPYGSASSNPYGSQGGYTHTGGNGQYGWTTTTFTWEDIFGSDWANMGATSPKDIHPEANASDSAEVRAAINAMNAGSYSQAANILINIPSSQRNARWYYLSALANHGAGNTSLGYEQIRKAVQMEPNNASYKQALNAFQQPGRAYTQEAQGQGFDMSRASNCCIDTCCCMAIAPFCCGGAFPLICCI